MKKIKEARLVARPMIGRRGLLLNGFTYIDKTLLNGILAILFKGRCEMPQYFKALATILVWIMWIVSLLMGFGTMAMGIMRGDLFNVAGPPHPMSYTAGFAVAAFYALVALYAMKVRKKIE